VGVPLATIAKISKVGGKKGNSDNANSIKIICKDLRILKFGFDQEVKHSRRDFITKVTACLPTSPEQVFAYNFMFNFDDLELDGWNLYDPIEDFKRMNIPNAKWRISDINTNYQISHSYPQKVCDLK
jgi:hypothetical protein